MYESRERRDTKGSAASITDFPLYEVIPLGYSFLLNLLKSAALP